MALIRWNPWSLDRFFEDDFDLPTFPGLTKLAGQGLNLYETDTAVVAEAALPGVSQDKVDVTIDDGIVRISGNREEKENKPTQKNFMSYLASSYNYSFRLPEGVLGTEPICELDNGILTLTFEKTQKSPPKKITVKAKTNK